MTYRLQFFSRPSDEGETPHTAEFGYDGSVSVDTFSEADIPELLARMDCIFGECLVVVEYPSNHKPSHLIRKAYRTHRINPL